MTNSISQREARKLRKRVTQLEEILRNQKNRWRSEWGPGWVNIERVTLSDAAYAKIATARLLNHAVIVLPDTANEIRFYAERLP
jgi:hypothetical protein